MAIRYGWELYRFCAFHSKAIGDWQCFKNACAWAWKAWKDPEWTIPAG